MTRLVQRAIVGLTLASTLLLSACNLFSEQKTAAREFFDVLATDQSAAYEMTAPEFKEMSSFEDLQTFTSTYPETLDVTDLRFNKIDQEGDYAELYGTVTYGTGMSESIGVYMYKSDIWRVGGFEMGI